MPKKASLETRLKMSISQMGHHRGGWKFSEKIKQKLSKAHKGVSHSLEHNRAVSIAKKGKKFSDEHRLKLSEARKKFFYSGGKPWNWINGIKNRDIHSLFNPLYVEWRNIVFKRDNWKCRIADKNCRGQLQAHHILSWRDYKELRYIINNGITLCQAHHPRKRAEEKRLIPEFQKLVSVSN